MGVQGRMPWLLVLWWLARVLIVVVRFLSPFFQVCVDLGAFR